MEQVTIWGRIVQALQSLVSGGPVSRLGLAAVAVAVVAVVVVIVMFTRSGNRD